MRLPTSFQLPTLLVLAATPLLTTANPISQANPPAWTPPAPNLTTTSLEILSASLTFDISYVSAHHGRLYTNALDPDALCQTNTPSQLFTPLATFVLDNTTETLRLYDCSSNWQQVYSLQTASGFRYVDDRGAPALADAWPNALDGWSVTAPSVGGQVYVLWRGKRMWGCDAAAGDGWWSLEPMEWLAVPMGSRGCVGVVARVVREELADRCVYTAFR